MCVVAQQGLGGPKGSLLQHHMLLLMSHRFFLLHIFLLRLFVATSPAQLGASPLAAALLALSPLAIGVPVAQATVSAAA